MLRGFASIGKGGAGLGGRFRTYLQCAAEETHRSSALGIKSIGEAGRRGSWRGPVSPRDGNLPVSAMVSLRRDRSCRLSKVGELYGLFPRGRRRWALPPPVPGSGKTVRAQRSNWRPMARTSRPCPITWLRPRGARACSHLQTVTVYLHRLLLLPRRACRFATLEGQRGRRRRGARLVSASKVGHRGRQLASSQGANSICASSRAT